MSVNTVANIVLGLRRQDLNSVEDMEKLIAGGFLEVSYNNSYSGDSEEDAIGFLIASAEYTTVNFELDGIVIEEKSNEFLKITGLKAELLLSIEIN